MNFIQMLQDIYVKYGFSREAGISLVRKGKSGAEEIQAIMKQFRANPPKQIAGSNVTEVKDYSDLTIKNGEGAIVGELAFPTTSNVLQFFTADGTKISVRPSGTEPKIKFYVEVKGEMKSASEYDSAIAAAEAKIQAVKADLGI